MGVRRRQFHQRLVPLWRAVAVHGHPNLPRLVCVSALSQAVTPSLTSVPSNLQYLGADPDLLCAPHTNPEPLGFALLDHHRAVIGGHIDGHRVDCFRVHTCEVSHIYSFITARY